MTPQDLPPPDEASDNEVFDARLKEALKRSDLNIRGDEIKHVSEEQDESSSSALAQGMRIGLEFVSGTLVGVLLGFVIDRALGTTPWFILLFTLLGFGAGMLNVYRLVNNLEEGIGINARKPRKRP